LHSDPSRAAEAAALLPRPAIIGHLSTSQPKKEWPIPYWLDLYAKITAAGLPFIFASGPSPREQALLAAVLAASPSAANQPLALPTITDLGLYLAVIQRASAFISGDTGPLHFAAGLGVPTLGIFGPTSARQWAPIGALHRHLKADTCTCSWHAHVCNSAAPCIASVKPEQAWELFQELLPQLSKRI